MSYQKLTEFENVFLKYCNYDVWLEGKQTDNTEILLSQIAMWFKYASLLDTVVNMEQLRAIYLLHKKWSMDFEDFIVYLNELCKDYNLNIDRVRKALIDTPPRQFFKADEVVYEPEPEPPKRKSSARHSSYSKRSSVRTTKVE